MRIHFSGREDSTRPLVIIVQLWSLPYTSSTVSGDECDEIVYLAQALVSKEVGYASMQM